LSIWDKLTRRELVLAELLVSGTKPVDMHKGLGITPRTVKDVLKRMYCKARIFSGVKHVRLAVELTYERYPHLRPSFSRPTD